MLAERMAIIRRAQQSTSPEAGRQATRRQRLTVEGGGTGGGRQGGGGGVRILSRDSFLVAAAEVVANAPASPPREDSPLLGSKKPSKISFADENGKEKKEVCVDWGEDDGEERMR